MKGIERERVKRRGIEREGESERERETRQNIANKIKNLYYSFCITKPKPQK